MPNQSFADILGPFCKHLEDVGVVRVIVGLLAIAFMVSACAVE